MRSAFTSFTHRNCPQCATPGRHLAASSENTIVDYYRCDECGHVWTISKLLGTSRDVTVAVSKARRAG